MVHTYINRVNKTINVLNIDECINALYIKYTNDILITRILSDIEYIIFEFTTNDFVSEDMIKSYKRIINTFIQTKNIKYFHDDYIILYMYISFYSKIIYNFKPNDKNILKNKTFEIPENINNVYINKYINLNIENILLETIRKNYNNNIDTQTIINLLRTDVEFNNSIRNYINYIINNTNNINIDKNLLNDSNFISNIISKIKINDIISENIKNNDNFKSTVNAYISKNISDSINSREFEININNILEQLSNRNFNIDKIISNDYFKNNLNNYIKNNLSDESVLNLIANNGIFIDKIQNYISDSIQINTIIQKIVNDAEFINIIKQYSNVDINNIIDNILNNERFKSSINVNDSINIDDLINKLDIENTFKDKIKTIINEELLRNNNINIIIDKLSNSKEFVDIFRKKILDGIDIIDIINDITNISEQVDNIKSENIAINKRINEYNILENISKENTIKISELDTKIDSISKYTESSISNLEDLMKIYDNDKNIMNSKTEDYDKFIDKSFDRVKDNENSFKNFVTITKESIESYLDSFKENIQKLINSINLENINDFLQITEIDLSDDVRSYINRILPPIIIDFINNNYLNSDRFKKIINDSIIENIEPDFIYNMIESKLPNENDIIRNVENNLKEIYDTKIIELSEIMSKMQLDINKNKNKISQISKDIYNMKRDSIHLNISTEDFNDEKEKVSRILKFLEIDSIRDYSTTNISELIKYHISLNIDKKSIKQVILELLLTILNENNIDHTELTIMDDIDEKIIKCVNLLNNTQLEKFNEILSNTEIKINDDFNKKIEDINRKLIPILDNENSNIAGIYNDLNNLSNKYTEIKDKINNINYEDIKEKIESILLFMNSDINNVINVIKHNLIDLNNFMYNQYNQGNIPKYIIETENKLRGYAETLNKIIYVINTLENTPKIDTLIVPKQIIPSNKNNKNDVLNLVKYNNKYDLKSEYKVAEAGINNYLNDPILYNIYLRFYNKYIVHAHINKKDINIYNLNSAYVKILSEYDNNSNYINDIIKDIYNYNVNNMEYYIYIKKYINILKNKNSNFLFSLLNRYIKYENLILKFRILLSNNNINNDVILYFINKIIITVIKFNVIYEYIKTNYNLQNVDNKCELLSLSQNIILDYICTKFFYYYYKNIMIDKPSIIYLYSDKPNNNFIDIDKLYLIDYLSLSELDKQYYKYLIKLKINIFEKYIENINYGTNIKEYINFIINKHIIINNNIKKLL
ncbi:unknown similar to AMEV156 [Mythimna separata entomopoxvirus 'L']|uniref:Uncharacterized protein n=1 Tax=Mythimna separata entomopoxvirus 'L' TaxID=1293572 RepID=A0A916KQW7_9POXV|nr:unknown similar to AMEV156 [Mythimna separata entomopoxvirus 'L']CCU56391.1 unknown similar to AMEV156 [Mythimna separata entomopoxvirus 'L']